MISVRIFSSRSSADNPDGKSVDSQAPVTISGSDSDVASSLLDCVEVLTTEGPMLVTLERLDALRVRGASQVDVALVNVAAVGDDEILYLVEDEICQVARDPWSDRSIDRAPLTWNSRTCRKCRWCALRCIVCRLQVGP